MAGIPLPKPISVAPFVPDTTSPTFTQIFDQTMGNAATPDDGFDQLFSEMAMLTDSAANIALGDDADMQSATDIAAGFSDAIEGELALALQPAEAAANAALSAYLGLTQPSAPTPTPIAPPTKQPPQPVTTDCGPVPQGYNLQKLPDMNVGDKPITIEVDNEQYDSRTQPVITVLLHCGDTSIFSIKKITQITGKGLVGGGILTSYANSWFLVVNPTKAGTFSAVPQEKDRSQVQPYFDLAYYQVTIH